MRSMEPKRMTAWLIPTAFEGQEGIYSSQQLYASKSTSETQRQNISELNCKNGLTLEIYWGNTTIGTPKNKGWDNVQHAGLADSQQHIPSKNQSNTAGPTKYLKYQVNIMIKVRPKRTLYRKRSKKLPASLGLLSAGSFNEKVCFCLRFFFAMR